MRARSIAFLVCALVAGLLGVAAPSASAAPPPEAGPTVYVGELTTDQLKQVADLGLDHGTVTSRGAAADGKVAVEVVLTRQQAQKLNSLGLTLAEKQVAGEAVSQRLDAQSASGYEVFRSYSEPGGIRDELIALTRQYPRLTKLVTIGKTVQGQNILAVKVTRNAAGLRDGLRPAVLYSSAQHAREWITPEMNRRLLRHYLENYRTDSKIRKIVDTTELWFLPVANPDGYDYTFTEGNRLWRKNLRDNDGDGRITGLDGVDLNRNFPYRWGYDNEGSSPSIGSETYRGAKPASEPETRALDRLLRRVGFEFQINYHSAAELLLYGVGWQVATPSPDDLLYETLAGDDAHPAVAGYDPDIAAELYTTNGETTEHAHNVYGTLAFTPEMSTCQTASAVDPDDAFEPGDCESGFNFPDSEALVQAEFEKNIPFALSVARSAQDPDDPVSVVGRKAPDFQVDSFDVSYGDPQTVAVTARRDLRNLAMRYSINGGRSYRVPVREWAGGERYGDEADQYYAEFRGKVQGARPGDKVRVWFTGNRPGKGLRTSKAFTYRVAEDTRNTVLVVANEDYEGVNPDYPASVTAPKYANSYVDCAARTGHQGLGVGRVAPGCATSSRCAVALPRRRLVPRRQPVDAGSGGRAHPDRHRRIRGRRGRRTAAVPDHLRPRLPERAGKAGLHRRDRRILRRSWEALGGIYYGLDGDPTADCVVTADLFSDCLLLADDFFQYYLGAYSRSPVPSPTGFAGLGDLADADGDLRRPGRRRQSAWTSRGRSPSRVTCYRSLSSRSSPAKPPVHTGARPAVRSTRTKVPGTSVVSRSTTPTCGWRELLT